MIRFRATFTGASGRSCSCEARANKPNGGAANTPADASIALLRKLLRSVKCLGIWEVSRAVWLTSNPIFVLFRVIRGSSLWLSWKSIHEIHEIHEKHEKNVKRGYHKLVGIAVVSAGPRVGFGSSGVKSSPGLIN